MQKLWFEEAWDKTIAPNDRAVIKERFEKTKNESKERISIIPIKQDYNHKKELLVMVLIHNFTAKPFSFNELPITYQENNKLVANYHFSFPNLKLAARTSMPWTFIFPESAQKERAAMDNGDLILHCMDK